MKRFVNFNRSVCLRLAERFPRLFHAGGDYHGELQTIIRKIISQRPGIRVLEAGGIDRPLLKRTPGMTYDGLDIGCTEQCRSIYDHFYQQPVEAGIPGTYDLIISCALLEHVESTETAFQSIYRSLANGVTVHYVPSRNHPYSVILRMVGHRLQRILIRRLRPWAAGVTGYKAYFDRCTPSGMKRLLARTGFTDVQVIPFYRANDYFSFFAPLFLLVSFWENLCRVLGLRALCSGFIVTAVKK